MQPALTFGIVQTPSADVRGTAAGRIGVDTAPVTALNDTSESLVRRRHPMVHQQRRNPSQGLTAGGPASTALTVGLNTATAGVFSGTANVGLTSQNPDMADLVLTAQKRRSEMHREQLCQCHVRIKKVSGDAI